MCALLRLTEPRSGATARAAAILFAFVLCVCGVRAQTNGAALTNAVDVISLPGEKASQGLKVVVTGVVTASDPALLGRFFVQDSTGGVFVDNANGPRLVPGQLVQVTGITYAGAYAPTITAPSVKVLGTAPLPEPKAVSVEELMSGADDSQRIEIAGVVRDVHQEGSRLVLDLVAGGYRFRAYFPEPNAMKGTKLLGAEIRVRGTAAEAHNRSLRQLIAIELYIPSLSDLVIIRTEPADPFQRPVIPLKSLAQYRPGNSFSQRVHVRGVCLQPPQDGRVFIEDDSRGLQIQSRQLPPLSAGDVVEAVGFLNFENYHPVLQDAIVQTTADPPAAIHPQPATIEEIQNGLFHACEVSLTGRLMEIIIWPGSQGDLKSGSTALVLQSTNFTFTAITRGLADQAKLGSISIGSVVQVSGICVTETDSDGKLDAFQILVGNYADIRVLEKPSWLTPGHLLVCIGVVGAALVMIALWSVIIARRNSILKLLVLEREKAQAALQEANNLLEERVRERTAQLKFEVTARKEAQVQFKATLAERTRLAQELHDTVEQTLTGISLQMDVAARMHGANPDNSRHHLDLARALMAKSKEEVRQSVWDLRSRALQQFDLSKALEEAARQVTSGSNIHIKFKTVGPPRPLPEVVEENLLRICQEAAANVTKHSGATTLAISLEFEPGHVVVSVSDDGSGFDQENVAGPQQGHFGLLGMSERAKRLGGRLVIESGPGRGTTVSVEIPADQPPEPSDSATAAPETISHDEKNR